MAVHNVPLLYFTPYNLSNLKKFNSEGCMNRKLLRALGKSGFDFEDVAIFTGIWSNTLVKIIRGEIVPDIEDQQTIADILDCKVEELFPQNGG